MFVSSNTLSAAKNYFKERISALYTDSESSKMFKLLTCERLNWTETDYLLNAGNQRVSESDLLYYRSAVHRLLNHEPFQYIIGKTEFFGLELICDARTLIPRPETEELVAWILEENPESARVHDICTGSACIALALKNARNDWELVASDVSESALEQANKNASLNNLSLTFRQLNILEAVNEEEVKFDIIVSNPPYIPEMEKAEMDANVVDFEPNLALFVPDNDPLTFYLAIANYAHKQLNSKGKLYFETHYRYAEDVVNLLSTLGFKNIELRKDLQSKPRMVKAELD
ncbi:MAG: peptide chain release factor N(5)-glutamine methyltransferase [Bacteroidota bacterium]|jgi:release factor glutamine methyltransferase